MSLNASDVVFLLTCPTLKAEVAYGVWCPAVSKHSEKSIFIIIERSEVINNFAALKTAIADHSSENFLAVAY